LASDVDHPGARRHHIRISVSAIGCGRLKLQISSLHVLPGIFRLIYMRIGVDNSHFEPLLYSGELTHIAANFHDCILPQTSIKKSAAYVSSFSPNVAIINSGFRLALAVASLAGMTPKKNIQKSSARFWKDQR